MRLVEVWRRALLAAVIAGVGASAYADDLRAPVDPGSVIPAAREAELAGDEHRAALLYRQAHAADPSDIRPLNALAALAARIGEPEAAAALFRSALAIDSRDRIARRGLGRALVELGRGDEALAVFDVLISDDAADPRSWNGKGLALDLLGDHAAAREAYRAGLALAPRDPELLAGLERSHSLAAAARPADVELALNAGRASALPAKAAARQD